MDRIEKDFELIFDTAMGDVEPSPPFEWVETLFAPGTLFSKAYEDFNTARNHLCGRFRLEEDDDDLELFMNGLLTLEKDLGRRMFHYGIRYANMKRE